MTRVQGLLGTAVVVAVLAYAGLAGTWVSRDPGWYAALPKPSFQPPDWVFGVIWPYNFVALVVAGLVLTASRPTGPVLGWLVVLVASAGFALTWAYLFYVPHHLGAAAVAVGIAAAGAWVLVGLAGRQVPWLAVLLLPYALWASVATALAIAYARS